MKNIYLKSFVNLPCNSLNDSKIKSHNNYVMTLKLIIYSFF